MRRESSARYRKKWASFISVPLSRTTGQILRIRIPHRQRDLQLKVVRALPNGNGFLSYIDAIGELDGIH